MSSSISLCYLTSIAASIVCACVRVCARVRGCVAVSKPELLAAGFVGLVVAVGQFVS